MNNDRGCHRDHVSSSRSFSVPGSIDRERARKGPLPTETKKWNYYLFFLY